MTARDQRNDTPIERINQLTRDLAELRALVIGRLPGATGGPDAGLLFRDDSGNLVMRAGRVSTDQGYSSDYGYGLDIRDGDGVQTVFITTVVGQDRPRSISYAFDATLYKTVTSGSFVDTGWDLAQPLVTSPGYEVFIPVYTDVGTAGEIRVSSGVSTVTGAQAINSAGVLQVWGVDWLPGVDSDTILAFYTIQARRTSGAGNVHVGMPFAWHFDPTNCTSGGTWFQAA